MCSEFEEMASPDPAQTYPPLAPSFQAGGNASWMSGEICFATIWANGPSNIPAMLPAASASRAFREHHAKGRGHEAPLS